MRDLRTDLSSRGSQIFLAALAALAVLSLAAHLRAWMMPSDDAFITFRYALNWAGGHGLVYNLNQRVLGTSTPGYALLLGVLARITDGQFIPVISRAINFCFLLAAALAFAAAGRRMTGEWWVPFGLAGTTLIGPTTLLSSISGMESSLFLALLGLGIYAACVHAWWAAAVSLGLLPLVRPEGGAVLILAGIAAVYWWWRSRPRDLKGLIGVIGPLAMSAAPGLTWVLFADRYYGSWVPHSVVAKSSGLYPIGWFGSLLSYADWFLKSTLLTPVVYDGRSRIVLVGVEVLLIGLAVVILVILLGARALAARHPPVSLAAMYVFFLMGLYSLSGTLIFPHYHAFSESFAKLFLWAGLIYLGRGFAVDGPGRSIYRKSLVGITGLLLFLPALVLYPWKLILYGTVDPGELGLMPLKQIRYKILADSLRDSLDARALVLLPEIGELGFYLPQATILDSAGLVSPEALVYFPASAALGPGGIPPEMVRDHLPDLVISGEAYCATGLLKDPWFLSAYRIAFVEDSHRARDDMGPVYVFVRNDYDLDLAFDGRD